MVCGGLPALHLAVPGANVAAPSRPRVLSPRCRRGCARARHDGRAKRRRSTRRSPDGTRRRGDPLRRGSHTPGTPSTRLLRRLLSEPRTRARPSAGVLRPTATRVPHGARVPGEGLAWSRNEDGGRTDVRPASHGGGEGNRTLVLGRPTGASPGAAGGKISPRGSHQRRTSRPVLMRCPSPASGQNRRGEPAQ
jgi:hypothetical protein